MHARSVYTHVYVAQINSWYFMQCAFNILRFMYVAMLAYNGNRSCKRACLCVCAEGVYVSMPVCLYVCTRTCMSCGFVL